MKTKHLIIFGISLILITTLVFALILRVNTFVSNQDQYKEKIDSLNIELQNLKAQQIILDKKIESYNIFIELSNKRIDSLKNDLSKTKKYYGDKIKNIPNYTSPQLESFFTNRYK
jgi:peptidoglycan hydrolase CwlO-like protein